MLKPFDGKCPICGGTGWVFVDMDIGSPGQSDPAQAPLKGVVSCECRKRQIIDARIRNSGLENLLNRCTFETFEATTPWQQKIKDVSQNYCNTLKDGHEKPWLYIGGQSGSGKTHLCTAICGELLRAGVNVKYLQWLESTHKFKSFVNNDAFSELLEPILAADVLYIDDLLKSKGNNELNPSEADIKLCFEILNGRYIRDKPTIISSEWYLTSELIPIDEATFSRVFEKTGYEFCLKLAKGKNRNYRVKDVPTV